MLRLMCTVTTLYLGAARTDSPPDARRGEPWSAPTPTPTWQSRARSPVSGLEEQQEPEPRVSIDAHTLPFTLPLHQHQALELLRDSEPLARVLGERFVQAFIEVKTLEWRLYNKVISSWEREYLLLNV